MRVHNRKRTQKVYSKEVNDFLERDDNPGNDPGVTEDLSVIENRGVIENNDVQIRVE